MAAFNLILVLVLFPETKYNRENEDGVAIVSTTPEEPVISGMDKGVPSAEQAETLTQSLPGRKGCPNATQYRLIQSPHPRWKESLLRDFVAPVRVAFYPIIFFAGLNLAGPANLLLYWNLIESSALGKPPYNFTESQIGYSNFGFAIGSFLGMAVAGTFSDWVSKKATKRNGGVREAEMRLPALLPFLVLTVVGSVVGGLAIERGWAWPVVIIFGYSLTGIYLSTIASITVAYAVDSYKPVFREIMVVGTVIRNTTGFAMTYWMPPMVVRDGYITPLMVWFTFMVGPILLATPLYFYGKRLRIATQNSSVHTYESIR